MIWGVFVLELWLLAGVEERGAWAACLRVAGGCDDDRLSGEGDGGLFCAEEFVQVDGTGVGGWGQFLEVGEVFPV